MSSSKRARSGTPTETHSGEERVQAYITTTVRREHRRARAGSADVTIWISLVGSIADDEAERICNAERAPAVRPSPPRRPRPVAIHWHRRDGSGELRLDGLGQWETVLHRVELDHAGAFATAYAVSSRNLRRTVTATDRASEPPSRIHVRISALRACAVSPSPRAERGGDGPELAGPAGEIAARSALLEIVDAQRRRKRAVRPVGSTWFGPAQ